MNNTKHVIFFKNLAYCVIFILLYITQTVPGLFEIRGVKPVWVVPAAVAIAMLEGEFIGGIYGALAGMLCDIGSFLLFGFYGFLTCLFCVGAGLLVIYLVRCNYLSSLLFVLIFMLIRGSLQYLFAYGMWGYENSWKVYLYQTIPGIVYTTLVSPLVFALTRKLHKRFLRWTEGV